jgi:hypothetical protein
MFGGCVVWTFVGSSSWFYSRYVWWMCCLNFCRKVQTTHPSNIMGVKPGTGPYKSSDSTSTKHSGSKTRNWTLQKFRQVSSSWSYSNYIWWICCLNFIRVQFLVLLPLYLVDVLSELLLGPVPEHSGSKTRNWTLQKFRQHIHQT